MPIFSCRSTELVETFDRRQFEGKRHALKHRLVFRALLKHEADLLAYRPPCQTLVHEVACTLQLLTPYGSNRPMLS